MSLCVSYTCSCENGDCGALDVWVELASHKRSDQVEYTAGVRACA